jgi:hypothetical protein
MHEVSCVCMCIKVHINTMQGGSVCVEVCVEGKVPCLCIKGAQGILCGRGCQGCTSRVCVNPE